MASYASAIIPQMMLETIVTAGDTVVMVFIEETEWPVSFSQMGRPLFEETLSA